jgi:subtilase family serine protease
MRNSICAVFIAAALTAVPFTATAQSLGDYDGVSAVVWKTIPGGKVLLPASSIRRPEDRGRRAHTHYQIVKFDNEAIALAEAVPKGASPNLLTVTETPASLACVYRMVTQANGCDPDKVSKLPSGGSNVIAIVDAYHNKTALKDLRKFSNFYNLPAPRLQIEYCSATTCKNVNTPPPADKGWAGEIALDLQWAHAMAPRAKLILVEAHSNSYNDLMRAVDRAADLVAAQGGGQVSMSWGGAEFSGQTSLDNSFLKPGVVFFASTGDHQNGTTEPDVNWPSTSPNVVAVGGTTIMRTSLQAFSREEAWLDTGGGKSSIYLRPAFQDDVAAKTGNHRGVPDISWNADPASGVPVYCSPGTCANTGGFFVFGGTSLAAPAVAAMTNNAGRFRPSSASEHNALYNGLGTARFTDVARGKCGNGTNGAFVNAGTGWDLCTGIGTPRGLNGL